MKNRFPLAVALLAGVLAVAGCSSNTQGDDASPVYLSVSYTLLPESWNVGSGLPLQFDTVGSADRLRQHEGRARLALLGDDHHRDPAATELEREHEPGGAGADDEDRRVDHAQVL